MQGERRRQRRAGSKQSVSDLARSYYERANARRLLLDRHAEAAADAEKALAIASKGGDPMLKQRIGQFVGLQKKLTGDLKGAIATFQQLINETDNRPGLGGWLFNSVRNIQDVVLLSGDLPQAEGHLRRLQSKIVEMRTSGIPQKQRRPTPSVGAHSKRISRAHGRSSSKRAATTGTQRRHSRKPPTIVVAGSKTARRSTTRRPRHKSSRTSTRTC